MDMKGSKFTSIIFLGLFFSPVPSIGSEDFSHRLVPAKSAEQAEAIVTVGEPSISKPQPIGVDPFEAILCGSHASQQTPECKGYQYQKAHQTEEAIEQYKKALALAQEAQNTRKTAFLLLLLGITHSRPGQTEEAVNYFRQAIASFVAIGDTVWVISSLYTFGDALLAFGQHENALTTYLDVFALTVAKNELQLEKKSDREFAIALVTKIATVAIQLGKYGEVINVLDKAAEVFKQRDDLKLNAQEYYLIVGNICREKLKNNQRALDFYIKALEIGQVDKDPLKECNINYQLGTLHAETKNHEKALYFLEQGFDFCEKASDFKKLYVALSVAGQIYEAQGKLEKALESFEKALKVYSNSVEQLNDQEKLTFRPLEGTTAISVGRIRSQLRQYTEAIDSYRRAREIFQQVGDKRTEMAVLVLLGQAYLDLGQFQDALFPLQQAQEAARTLKDTHAEAEGFKILAFLSDMLGNVDNVQKYYLQALELYQQDGNLQQEAFILAEIGRFHQYMSKYDEALNFYHQALGKYRAAKDRKGEGEILATIGEVYRWFGDNENALRWYRDALEASKAARDVAGTVQTLAQLFLVEAWLGNEEALSEHVSEAEKAEKEIHERISLAAQKGAAQQMVVIDDILALTRLIQVEGEISARWGQPDQAISKLNQVLRVHQTLPRTRVVLKETAIDCYFLGFAHSRLKQYDEALKALQTAEEIARQLHSPELYWILNMMGSVHEQQGKLKEALGFYTQAIEVLEKVGIRQHPEEIRLPVRELTSQFYRNVLGVLYKLYVQTHSPHYIEQAFFYYEKGKARTLLDLLGETNVHIREGMSPTLLKEEEILTSRISRLHRALANPRLLRDQEKSLLTTLEEQEQAWQALQVKIAVTNSKYVELASPQIASIQQVQKILDKETVLLEYILTEEKSFLWAVSQEGVQGYELPVAEEIIRQVEQYLPTLKAPLYGKEEIRRHLELGSGLYRTLLQPAASQIKGKTKLIIVPDGGLYYLPFETLVAHDTGNTSKESITLATLQSVPYLTKDYTVIYTPSASVLITLERNRDKRRQEKSPVQAPLLAFGDPLYEAAPSPGTVTLKVRGAYEERGGSFQRLEHSAKEVETIAKVYETTLPSDAVNLRENATEKNLREMDLTRYRILHFATHAILSDEVKWITQPALVLSLAGTDETYDGFLQMKEIFNLRLNADLVVLSACDTGKGKLLRGEGIVGLTRAFMYAGTPSVAASLWKVNDQSTSLFMEFFYRNLKEGQPKAEALRQAKKQLMQTQVWSDALKEEQSLAAPYFWAPFILVGSGN
jgi:CHAT domain-containing protein/Tfp pilus assembly protein PilF